MQIRVMHLFGRRADDSHARAAQTDMISKS